MSQIMLDDSAILGRHEMAQPAVLAGVRVLSLEQVHVLPWGTAFLADFGAEVIRVESSDHTNDRRSGPFPDGEPGDEWWNEGGTFAYWARNKESLCLDVTQPLGKEVFLKLVAQSDIVTDNFRPGRWRASAWITTVWPTSNQISLP